MVSTLLDVIEFFSYLAEQCFDAFETPCRQIRQMRLLGQHGELTLKLLCFISDKDKFRISLINA